VRWPAFRAFKREGPGHCARLAADEGTPSCSAQPMKGRNDKNGYTFLTRHYGTMKVLDAVKLTTRHLATAPSKKLRPSSQRVWGQTLSDYPPRNKHQPKPLWWFRKQHLCVPTALAWQYRHLRTVRAVSPKQWLAQSAYRRRKLQTHNRFPQSRSPDRPVL
jgi:hypothetical protein